MRTSRSPLVSITDCVVAVRLGFAVASVIREHMGRWSWSNWVLGSCKGVAKERRVAEALVARGRRDRGDRDASCVQLYLAAQHVHP